MGLLKSEKQMAIEIENVLSKHERKGQTAFD